MHGPLNVKQFELLDVSVTLGYIFMLYNTVWHTLMIKHWNFFQQFKQNSYSFLTFLMFVIFLAIFIPYSYQNVIS